MGIDNEKLLDLVATTLKDLPKQTFEVAWDNQNYEFCRIYQEKRIQIDGGTSIERNVMLDPTGNASYRKLFDVDNPTVGNVQLKINVPWTQIGTNYSWDILEILRNRNSAKGYISLMDSRRTDGLWSLANLVEDRAWRTPTNVSDNLYPFGVPYYLNQVASGTTGGFVGQTIVYGDTSTGTVCAGIDAATNLKWRNYADVYTQVDNSLLRKLRKAFMLTHFKPPLFIKSPGKDDEVGTRRMYAGADVNVSLQDLADKRDDATQPKDLAGKNLIDVEGTTYFNRVPIVYITQLDTVSYSPIYVVDFKKFIPFVQDGFWMEESKPFNDRLQHTTMTVYLDGSHNNLCINRRTCGFVMHTQH